jgi:hypothetical protein
MAMTAADVAQRFAQFEIRLGAARALALHGDAGVPPHYLALLAEIEAALPVAKALYAAHLEQLHPGPAPAAPRATRSGAARIAAPEDVHAAVHAVRHAFYDIVHPLESIGKWPPDGFDPSAAPAPRPKRPAAAKKAMARRSVGKWPPDGW